MGIISWSALVGDASNKIGALVFSKNQYGPMARIYATSTNVNSPAQQGKRATQAQLTKSWAADLTDAQRNGWEAFAAANPVNNKFGVPIYLTGFLWYVKANQALTSAGQAQISDAPANLTVGNPAALTITATTSPQLLKVDASTEPGANDTPVIWATPMIGLGQHKVHGRLRIIDKFAPGTAGPWTVTANWQARFGNLNPYQLVSVAVQYTGVLNGALGPKIIAMAQPT
jgi:hypothetical protein